MSKQYRAQLEKQLERAERAPSFSKYVSKIKKAHPSWGKNLRKYLGIGCGLSEDLVERMPDSRLLSLDEAFCHLGRARARLEFIGKARELITAALGKGSLRVPCKELDSLHIRCQMSVDLLLDYVWALQEKTLAESE